MNRFIHPRRLGALGALLCPWIAAVALAAPLPYDESADAKAAVQQALVAAKASHANVLVIFGANWCEDCRALDQALGAGRNAALMAHDFNVVKVDVGNFDRNIDLSAAYGNPIKKGIPAAVVLSPGGQVLYATKAGELADARRMSEDGIYDFFKQVSQIAAAKH
jgi:protein disulfide-isomerase